MKNPQDIDIIQTAGSTPFPLRWVCVGAAITTLLLSFPVWLNPTAHLGGAPFGDRGTNLWNLWWVYYALFHLGQSPLDCGLVFYPWGCDVRFHTLSLLNGIIASPITAMFGSVVAYNLLFLLHSWGTVVFASRWAYGYGLSAWASAWVGVAVTFGPYRFSHLDHVNLFSTTGLFASFWLCDQALRSSDRKWLAWFAVAWVCTGLIDWYYALFVCLYLAVQVMIEAWTHFRDRAFWKRVLWLVIPVMCLTLTVLLYFSRGIEGDRPVIVPEPVDMRVASFFSNDLLQLFLPNWVIAWAGWTLIPNGPEFQLHPGFIVLMLSVCGVMAARQIPRRNGVFLTACVFLMVSLGPALVVGGSLVTSDMLPFVIMPTAIYTVLPVLDSMRVFTRFAFPGYCLLTLLAAGMLSRWINHSSRNQTFLWGMTAVIVLLESGYQIPRMVQYPVPQAVRELPPGPVAGFPYEPSAFVGYHMYLQTIHNQPVLLAEFSRLGEYRRQYLSEWPALSRLGDELNEARSLSLPPELNSTLCKGMAETPARTIIRIRSDHYFDASQVALDGCDGTLVTLSIPLREKIVADSVRLWSMQ